MSLRRDLGQVSSLLRHSRSSADPRIRAQDAGQPDESWRVRSSQACLLSPASVEPIGDKGGLTTNRNGAMPRPAHRLPSATTHRDSPQAALAETRGLISRPPNAGADWATGPLAGPHLAPHGQHAPGALARSHPPGDLSRQRHPAVPYRESRMLRSVMLVHPSLFRSEGGLPHLP